MATIDNLDISNYFQYAQRVSNVEKLTAEIQLEQAHAIPPQTIVVDVHARSQEMEQLFGASRSAMPWAYFLEPKDFTEQRRSSFAFDRICPSLGSQDRQVADLEKLLRLPIGDEERERNREREEEGEDEDEDERPELEAIDNPTSEVDRKRYERKILCTCLEQIENLNKQVNFVTARIGQFLQG